MINNEIKLLSELKVGSYFSFRKSVILYKLIYAGYGVYKYTNCVGGKYQILSDVLVVCRTRIVAVNVKLEF